VNLLGFLGVYGKTKDTPEALAPNVLLLLVSMLI